MTRRSSIMRRWIFNSFGVIIALLLIFGAAAVLAVRSYYYKGVETAIRSRIVSVDSLFSQLTASNTSVPGFDSLSREFVENFQDKDLLEMQVVNRQGQVVLTSTGFPAAEREPQDFLLAVKRADSRAKWVGHTAQGEHVMAMTLVLRNTDGSVYGGVRYVASLSLVDRQVWMFLGLVGLIGVGTLFLVMISSSYFISSIVRPVGEINRAARQIALGDYDSRIEKTTNDEIGELIDTINYMAGEIAAAEKMKNDFISTISHELRTPLTAIKGWAETMRQDGASDPEMTRKGLEVIDGEVGRLSGIVEDLLDFSRMQSGHLVMKFARVDISAELGEAVFLYRERASREGVELVYIEPESLPPVLGDRDRLEQVFINILDNAVKYSDRGGRIRVETADMGAYVQVVVSDTGVGISKADLPNIKKKFYKANRSRPGSGIGLALADEIVRRHKGRLEIDSDEGVGTTVTVTLPAALADAGAHSPGLPPI